MSLLKLTWQKSMGWILFIPFCGTLILIMKFWRRYRIENHDEIRRQYKIYAKDRSPLLICANHLTYVDPPVIIWALAWHIWYVFHFRSLSWNLAATEYRKNPFFRAVLFFAKGIYINRQGGKNHYDQVLGVARQLMLRGEPVTIFPEGRRSRTGRFNENALTYGSGKLVASLEYCRVLCVYLRGNFDSTYTGFPKKGTTFYLKMKLIEPKTALTGKEGYAEIVNQIGSEIAAMEKEYFTMRPESAPERVVSGEPVLS